MVADSPWGARIKAELEAQGWKVYKHTFPILICFKGDQSIVLEGRAVREGLTADHRAVLLGLANEKRELKVTVTQRKPADRRVVIDGRWEKRIVDLKAEGLGPTKIYRQLIAEGFLGKMRTVENRLKELRARGIL